MEEQVVLRAAVQADVPSLGRLGAALVDVHHLFDELRFLPVREDTEENYAGFLSRQIDKQRTVVLVATVSGEVVGYVYAGMEGTDYMALRGPAGVIYDLIVHEAYRGRGIGDKLLTSALEELRSLGADRAVLFTAENNRAGRALFEAMGFRPTMREMTCELSGPV